MTVERERNRWSESAPRMRDISHIHREHNPRAWHWFARGPIVAADGGRAEDDEERRERNVEDEALRDVSHEPAHGEGANRVWERGDNKDEGDE